MTINSVSGQAFRVQHEDKSQCQTPVVPSPVTLQFASSVTGYRFASAGRSIDVPIVSQTTPPNLTIAGKGAVNEGDDAVFTITADNQSNVPVTVEVRGRRFIYARTGINYVTDDDQFMKRYQRTRLVLKFQFQLLKITMMRKMGWWKRP